MSLSLPNPTQSRRSKTILSPEGTTAKFLYTILKQLDLKTVDWNEVAAQLDISNGHAARMRYSRFKTQIEGLLKESKPKPKPEQKNKVTKQKDKRKRTYEDDYADQDAELDFFHEEQLAQKSTGLSTTGNWNHGIPIGVVKAEQDQQKPNTTILSIKTDKGIEQARIHSPTATLFHGDDPAIIRNTARPSAQHSPDAPYVHLHHTNHPQPGTVAMSDVYMAPSYPVPHARLTMQNPALHQQYSSMHDHQYSRQNLQPRPAYGNLRSESTPWNNGSMQPYHQQANSSPYTVYPPLHEMPTHAYQMGQYNGFGVPKAAHPFHNVSMTQNIGHDGAESTLDLAQFADEFGDWPENRTIDMIEGNTLMSEHNADKFTSLNTGELPTIINSNRRSISVNEVRRTSAPQEDQIPRQGNSDIERTAAARSASVIQPSNDVIEVQTENSKAGEDTVKIESDIEML